MKENAIYSPTIYTQENMDLIKNIPVLDNSQIYVYVMFNDLTQNIKIGKTTNMFQRLTSLSGSNGAGGKITKLYCSPATYVKSIETTCHNHYEYARIPKTEWFKGTHINFNEVVEYVDSLFKTQNYKTCNELRKRIYAKKHKKDME